MSSYFDKQTDKLRRNPGALLEIEEQVWTDVLRTINMSGFPEEYRQVAFEIREYMYKSTTKDDFIQMLKDGYVKNGMSIFTEKMHDLFHEVRHFVTQNGLDGTVDWDDVDWVCMSFKGKNEGL